MRHYLSFAIVFCAVASTCDAQFAPCKVSKPSTVEQRDGITELKVSFLEPSGEREAHIFLPDSDAPVPGIVFSHSAIHGVNTRVDLLRFARGLALAGAASIVLDGSIEWERPNDDSKQAYHLTACAGHWLLENVSVDRQRLAQAGPGAWSGSNGGYCLEGESPCYHSHLWLNFGLISNAEFRNTERMLTAEGRLHMAQWTQRHLKLKEINPGWLEPGLPHGEH
ncbi:MAG TPA: hypothetical protein VN948_20330 [Terriglobales bacterium]|nr:hypothetical protein [Terriglobales bacterium]